MPIILLVIAALCFFWVTIPLLIIGLFCDCRYQFRGPDFQQAGINTFMDQAADTAESIKNAVMEEEGGPFSHHNDEYDAMDDEEGV